MKRTMMTIGLVAGIWALVACGGFEQPGPPTTQHRELTDLHSVVLQTSGDLTIRIGTDEELAVTAGTNVVDDLTSDITDGTLVLGTRPNRSVNGSISYTLTVPALTGIEIEGSGNVIGTAVLAGDARLTISGSGTATLTDLELSDLSADLSGSGDMVLSGTSSTTTVELSGSGDYDASALTAAHISVDSSGSGSVRVNVTEHLSVTSSGSGDVAYSGNPAQVDRNATGSGEVAAG